MDKAGFKAMTGALKYALRQILLRSVNILSKRRAILPEQPEGAVAMKVYRQGDILVAPITEVPADLERVPKDAGRLVLAYGEVTGHAHVVEGAAELFQPADLDELEQRFLRVEREAVVVHDEHALIALPPGDYVVRRQREYAPERSRFVAD